ncbi:3-oxoadipate CoA-transferase subunit A [bacterium HR24]|nr:3-oxoadipate CoA-transferase subunit A [bacterium HR24]
MARELEVLAEGQGEYHRVDPDGFREWVRDHKQRAMVPKLMSAKEAVERFVQDGDYIVYECNYIQRGPAALIREIIRQGKKDLWVGAKFTWVDVALLVEAGCASKLDVGFFLFGPVVDRAVKEGRVKIYEYSNVVMTNRIKAGAMGLPFIPVRSFGGTDGFKYSGAKLIKDPYTGQPITIVPALNPDVALIHVHQADIYGNARVFGTGISDVESALASRKVIISTEEIVDTEEIRNNPGITAIPYYCVDAVVHLPFGAYPGEMAGRYASDVEHVVEVVGATMRGFVRQYLDKWVYSAQDHFEMLDKLVGWRKLQEMVQRATIKEGYLP